MNRFLFSIVIFVVLVSACSSTTAKEPATIVVGGEVQASSEGGEVVGGASSLAQDAAVELEDPGATQPSEEIEAVTAATETPGVGKPALTDTPQPALQGNAQPEAKTLLPTATPVVTAAPTSTSESTATLTPTPDDRATARISASIYEGPSTAYRELDIIGEGEQVAVLGVSSSGGWFYVRNDEDVEGFAYAPRIDWAGDIASLPIITSEAEAAARPAQTQAETITTSSSGSTATAGTTAAAASVELVRIPDTDPVPPLAILVSTVRIEENGYYKVTGTVRNDGSETHGGVGVVATFFTELECGERYVQSRGGPGQPPSGSVENVCDPNWFGPVKVYVACQLLEPGAECPFSLEIYGRDYVSYHLHPEGTPVEYRQPASLVVSGVNVYNNGLGYVRITGTVTNGNPFMVMDANIAGTLIDANGQIVSVGSVLMPGEIVPGASIDFDLRIEYEPYANYQISAQAMQI